jgi:type II secretory pathway component GspD/PulD (secretin)
MSSIRRLLAALLACVLCAAMLTHGASRELAGIENPNVRRADYNFRGVPIEEVFDMLSRAEKVNIILTKGVSGNVTLTLYNATLKEAIYGVAQAAGFWVEIRGGDYVIMGKEGSTDYPSTNTQIKTLKVQYSDTKQIADIATKYASRYGKITPLLGRRLIVVEDLPGYIDRIEKLVEQLDVQPKQVLIEAKILEVTLDESEQYGIDWKKVFGSATIGTVGLAGGTAAAPTQGFFFSLLNSKLEVFLNALASRGRVRTLATPKLLALENQEAKAVIGDSTGYKVTTTINLVTTESIQFLESGVILKVTPSVDQQGRIMLRVHPEVSSATLNLGVPSKKSTEVTTELIAEDGQSIFIGGLIKSGSNQQRNAVPVLGTVPGLGYLFGSTTQSVSASETIVVITPHVIREPRDAERFTAQPVTSIEGASRAILKQELQLHQRTPPLPGGE